MQILVGVVLFAVLLAMPVSDAFARSLRSQIIQKGLDPDSPIAKAIRPLGNVVASQVANQLPTLSSSAGYTFEYDESLGVFARVAKTFGSLFVERAVTVGRGKLNVAGAYSYVRFDSLDGHDIGKLRSRVEQAFDPGSQQEIFSGLRTSNTADFRTAAGLADFADFVAVEEDLKIEAQVWDFSLTYGVLHDLDVNVELPVIRTYQRSSQTDTTPDPRCVAADVGPCQDLADAYDDLLGPGALNDDGFLETDIGSRRGTKLGIGDLKLRGKYVFLKDPARLATIFTLALPTGDANDYQGTGDTRLQFDLVASGEVTRWLELHGQAGVELNADDVDRSQARYAFGFTAQPFDLVAASVDFIGRSEFNALTSIPGTGRLPKVQDGEYVEDPLSGAASYSGRGVFFDVGRNDILDLSFGVKIGVGTTSVLSLNMIVPLNDDGLRADFVPTIGFESLFSLL